MIEYTKPMQWHRDRQKGLGGTDAASILGVGYHPAQSVFEAKTADEPIVSEPSERMLHGLFNEEYIAKRYREMSGLDVENAPDLVVHPKQKFRLCSPDRFAKLGGRKKRRRMLEFKSVYGSPGPEWGEIGTDHIPDGFLIQVLHDLDVCLAAKLVTEEEAELVVNFVGHDTRIYLIERRETLMVKLTKIEEDFWSNVSTRTPVDDWRHPLAPELSAEIAFSRPGTTKHLPPEAAPLVDMLEKASELGKESKKLRSKAKTELLKMMSGAETGILPDARKVRAKMTVRKGYTVGPTEYLDFRLAKGSLTDGPSEHDDEAAG